MSVIRPFDTHIHLQHLRQPVTSCVERSDCLTPAVTHDDWEDVLRLMTSYDSVFGAIGIHPWHAHQYDKRGLAQSIALAERLLQAFPSLCIGEIGLDFDPRTPADQAWQIVVFESFMALAQKYARPVSIHLRKAFSLFDELLTQFDRVSGFLHGFSGGVGWARHFVRTGRFLIGVNATICRDNARRYHQLVRDLPLESIVLETDGPYVRLPGSQMFHCDDIIHVAGQVATLRAISTEQVMMITHHNARSLLNAILGQSAV